MKIFPMFGKLVQNCDIKIIHNVRKLQRKCVLSLDMLYNDDAKILTY